MPRSRAVRARALRELQAIENGEETRQSTVEEFQRCPDWQSAAQVVLRALDAALREGPAGGPGAPPAWLPPVL